MFEFAPPIDRRSALRRISLALGGIATAPLASGLLSGCRTPEADALANYEYSTLTEAQQQTLTALVDYIIPQTDTPGAAEAGVPQFIDTMLTGWYGDDERAAFLADLDAIDGQAEGGSFAALDAEAQRAFVAALDAAAFAPQGAPDPVDDDVAEVAAEGTAATDDERKNEVAGMQGDLGEAMDESDEPAGELNTGEGTATVGPSEMPPFYRQLKELTVAGYYTSKVGATQELQWAAVPGRYEADLPLAEVGRAWA